MRKFDKKSQETNNFCLICKRSGHTKNTCYKLKTKMDMSTKINVIDTGDMKYHVTAKINNTNIPAYIDFACNVMKISTAKSLQLPIDKSKQTMMRGETKAKLKIDEVEREVPILIVNDAIQDMELLIGRTFTEGLIC